MKKQLAMVSKFAEKYSINHAQRPSLKLSKKVKEGRKFLIRKMSKELILAMNGTNVDKLAIALANLQFVLFGTVGVFGFKKHFEKIFEEVWKSNMTRSHNKDKSGKLIKGRDFKEPQISI